MTIQNCIKLLEAYKKQSENPINENGMALSGDARQHIIEQSKANYENMKQHILNSRKFKGHPIIAELQDINKPANEEKEENGKKSKR